MSNYLAIRGVTETLRSLLEHQMEKNRIAVSSVPPDLESDPKVKRVNLYLYKVVENAYLKNQEIPGEGHPAAYGHPPLSLVLYYLLTAFPDIDGYNKDYDLTVHEILADAMRVFHDYPILSDSMEISAGSGGKLLHTSLQNQFENVKITLEPLDTEELTKIWMGLTKPYRLSVGYAVSVVQIESKKPRRLVRPVKTRQLHTMQLRRPQIKDIATRDPSDLIQVMPPATARIGDELMVGGMNFLGMLTQVVLGSVKIAVTPASDSLITLIIPDDPDLQPGVQTVGVMVKMATEVVKGGYDDHGETTSGEMFVPSNQMAFMLVPKMTGTSPASGDTATILTVEGERLYKEGLKTFILIGDRAIEVQKPGNTDPWDPPTATKIHVPLTALRGLFSGKYPIRIRINGAENLEENQEFELYQGTLSFNGLGAHVAVSHSDSLRIEAAISVEAWVKMADLGDEAWRCPVVSKHGPGSGWTLRTGRGHASFMVTIGSSHHQADTGEMLSLNRWYHLAGTYDGNTLKIYVNGQLISTESVSGTITQDENDLNIGRNPVWHARCFKGEIGEVRVWNIARTQEEINANMRRVLAGTEAGLVGYWRFEEGSGNTAKDLTSGHNDGSLMDGVQWSQSSLLP